MNTYERFWLRANRENIARALHATFECDVCHLPADDPEWLERADAVIAAIGRSVCQDEQR